MVPVRLWKVELERLANELGREISVCHFPPGTSKWNKIEHRLFSFISMNWRGMPLPFRGDHHRQGTSGEGNAGPQAYPAGVKVSAADVESLNPRPARFHGDWNYTVAPRITDRESVKHFPVVLVEVERERDEEHLGPRLVHHLYRRAAAMRSSS